MEDDKQYELTWKEARLLWEALRHIPGIRNYPALNRMWAHAEALKLNPSLCRKEPAGCAADPGTF